MIVANDQATYDAYWAAYRHIRGSGLRINVDPHVGPLLAVARRVYVQLENDQNASHSFAAYRHVWLNVAQHVAYRASQEMANPTPGVAPAQVLAGLVQLGATLGVDLVGDPQAPADDLDDDLNL